MSRYRFAGAIPALLWALAGCSIEKPQAPSFETDINVPTGSYRYTVSQLIESSDVVQGDTTGHNPVEIAWRGRIDSVGVGDRLHADASEHAIAASLGDLTIAPPPPIDWSYGIRDFAPFAVPDSASMPVPEFSFQPLEGSIPPVAGFSDGTLASGTLTLSIENRLPVSIDNLRIEILNGGDSTPVAGLDIAGPILPGERATAATPLDGVRMESGLRARLASGHSPGSGGTPVTVTANDAIALRATFADLRFDRLTAPLAYTSVSVSDSSSLGSDLVLQGATIESADLPITVANSIPVPVTVQVRLPDVKLNGAPWSRSFAMPAGTPAQPAMLQDHADLSGASLATDLRGVGLRALRYTLDVETDGSGGAPVTLDRTMGASMQAGAFRLSFASVTASFDPRETELDPIQTSFDLPPGTEGLSFTDATLRIVVDNGVQIPGELSLTVSGSRGGQDVSLPLQGMIDPATPGGPVTTELAWNASNSDVVSLVNLHPDEIRVTGTVRVGDGQTIGTVRKTDVIQGRYEIEAPLRVRIETTELRPDSFAFEVNGDLQDRIREDVREGSADLTIQNHLPIGASVRLCFASTPENLRNAPDVVLAAVQVSPGGTDPATGRVTSATNGTATIELTRDQIPFFARDRVYGQAVITLQSGGAEAVELMTDDYITVAGILRLRMEVHK